MSIDTVAPAQQLAHLATLAQQLSEAARTLAGAVAATEPAGVADPLPGIDPAPAPASSSPRGSAAELAAYREHLYARIHATGTEGATTAELVAGSSTLNRVKVGLRTLVHQGRVFRTGNGTLRWYSDRNRQALADLMRQAVPAHDLTVPETANLLRLSEQRVRDMATAGQLAGRRVGKTLVIHRDAVLDHIQAIATPHTEGGTTMGRPTKLTPELADRFVTALEEGNSIRRAAALCGITRSTAHLWLARGEEEDAPPEFSDFSDRVTRARTRALGELWNAAFRMRSAGWRSSGRSGRMGRRRRR
ncbi:helix-turn-helix domain-containing protein [Planomonospora algeriensis]